MTSPSRVRRAVPEDYAAIWQLFDLLHKENAMVGMSREKLDFILMRVLAPETIPPGDTGLRGYMGVIGPVGGPLEGFILMCIGTFWYSNDLILEEYANFVHPDHRRSNHAKTFVNYAKKLAVEIGLPLVIGIISNQRTAAKVRLYRRQLPEAGAFFVYNAERFGSKGAEVVGAT